MPLESQIAHRNVRNTNLPYRSNMSPIETEACFVTGSQDLLTSVAGYCERRPGFANALETTPTAFNNLQRLFTWDRFDGTFIEMAVDINASSQAIVYKRVVGTDNSFSSIYTDTSPNVFDFFVSNNTVYFMNGNVAKAWDPSNGVRNWGISIGSVSNSTGPNTAGTGADDSTHGGSAIWSNPTNVSSSVNFATADTTISSNFTHFLNATQFAFSIPSTTTITGIQMTFVGANTANGTGHFNVVMLKSGAQVGTTKTVSATLAPTTMTLGSSSDLWGTTWTSNDINQTTFGVAIQANGVSGIGNPWEVDNVQITIFGLGGPTVTVSGSAGSFSATTGYQYVFCYGNSNTGHISSPSPASASTGVFANKLNVQVSLTASTDPQVNQIHVFRSTDSVATGNMAGTHFELPTSPYANSTANITDNAADTSLNIFSLAPISGFNDPPTPGFKPVYFAGRCWYFLNNKLYFSGLEEITTGVPEESFPSGVGGNYWNFDQPIQALAVAGTGLGQGLMIFCGGRLYGISGNSLDTFRRFVISNRRGCRSRSCVTGLGGMVAWLDSSMQIWGTDGNQMQELSIDIRPDLAGLTATGASLTFHTAGKFHWLVVQFPTKLFLYDMDLEQWMPPWNVSSNYIFSGETSAGNYDLMLATATKALTLSTTAHNDNGTAYTPIARTNLFSVVPDFGRRFSYAAMGLYDEPTRTGYPVTIEVDTNNVSLADVKICSDDDPLDTATVYTSIATNITTPERAYNRTQGANLIQNVYQVYQPAARWIGLQVKGKTVDDALKIYTFILAYKSLGGR